MHKMFKTIIYSIVIIVPFCTSLIKCDEQFLEETELLMSFMVFRHGDRAPVEVNVQYATDQVQMMNLIQKCGYGQLTEVGLRRGYNIGKFIRQRYDDLLSNRYNQSEIYIRSTDSTRAKMTVLAAMAAVFPVKDSWCDDIEGCDVNSWTPVPYTTEAANHDFNLAMVNCPTYIAAFKKAFLSPSAHMAKYTNILEKWSKLIGVNLTPRPNLAYLIYDVYTSQMSMGVPLPPELDQMFPEIEMVAGEAIKVVFGSEEYISLGAGVLLKKFLDAANSLMNGENVPSVHVYSAHDVNVYTLMAITRVRPLPGVPKYGAIFSLELRRVLSTGMFIIVPVYVDNPDQPEVTYPKVDGCDDECELAQFQMLVRKKQLDLNEWRTRCIWSEDYNFDLSSIA